MRKILLILSQCVFVAGLYGQGTVQFNNFRPVDADVLLPNGEPIASSDFVAQLWAGPEGAVEADLVAENEPSPFLEPAPGWEPGKFF